MAQAIRRGVRNLPARAGGGRRSHGQRPIRRQRHLPWSSGCRAGTDGARDHPLHGSRLRRASEPGRHDRIHAPGRLPGQASADVRGGPVRRSCARDARADRPGRQAGDRGPDTARQRNLRRDSYGLGAAAHRGSGQRDPRHCVGSAADRRHGRHRRRQLHRAGRDHRRSGEWCLDESGQVPRPGAGARRLDLLVGVPGRTADRCHRRGRVRAHPARPGRRRVRQARGPGHARHGLVAWPPRSAVGPAGLTWGFSRLQGMNQPLTLMAVHAHPDDESSSTGGVLATYSDEGVRTIVVTCTNGEFGDGPAGLKPGEEGHDTADVAQTRLAELRESCKHLGVTELETLGYHDSGMPEWEYKDNPQAFCNVPLDTVIDRIGALIEMRRSAWQKVAQALREAGEQIDDWEPTEEEIANMRESEARITTTIDIEPFLERKRTALITHASQIADSWFSKIPPDVAAEAFGQETFILSMDKAHASVPETDLLSGLR